MEILREIGTPGVQETFDKIREVAIIGRDIMQIMKEPEWQRNLENMRLVSQNFNQASYRLTLNMPNLTSGVYAVQVSDGTGWKEVKKIAL